MDFDKLDRKKFNKEFVFVTEDGKTAECFEEIGKIQVFVMILSSITRNIMITNWIKSEFMAVQKLIEICFTASPKIYLHTRRN